MVIDLKELEQEYIQYQNLLHEIRSFRSIIY
jgi:hypothetical protein